MRTKPQATTIGVFRGPNGWYSAPIRPDGSHWQPADGGRYASRRDAERALAAAEDDSQDTE